MFIHCECSDILHRQFVETQLTISIIMNDTSLPLKVTGERI